MEQKCIGPGPCKITPLDRNLPLARSIQITSPSLQERRDRAASAAERRIRTQRKSRRSATPRSSRRSATPRSSRRSATPSSSRRSSNSSPAEEGVAEFVNDLEDYDYSKGLFIRPRSTLRNMSMVDNFSKDARIKRTVKGDRVGSLTDYMRAECVGAQCNPLHDPRYYTHLKNRATYNRQRDLQRRLVRTDIPQSRQQRTLRSRQHDVADRLTQIDEGLDNDVMSRVHHFLKKKGHDLDVNKRYLERRGW